MNKIRVYSRSSVTAAIGFTESSKWTWSFSSSDTMPPKSRKKHLSDERVRMARESKRAKVDEPALEQQPAIAATSSASAESTATASPVVTPEESDRSGATFDPEQEVTCSREGVLEQFVEDWLLT